MQKIFKIGNSMALTIPKAFADQLGLDEGALVQILLINNELILRPAKPQITLTQLLEEKPNDFFEEQEFGFGSNVG